MQYEIDKERESLIAISLDKEDIKKGLQQIGQTNSFLINYLEKEENWKNIIDRSSPAITRYNDQDRFFEVKSDNINKDYKHLSYLWIIIIPIILFIYYFKNEIYSYIPNFTAWGIGLLGTIFTFYLSLLMNRRNRSISIKNEHELFCKKSFEDLKNMIVENWILPALRLEINNQIKIKNLQNNIRLPKITVLGLAEVFHPVYEVPTKAKEKLDQLISIMPGGSIGISGPRGVGKSTVLWSFCEGLKEAKEKKIISLLTSAPINYDPKDFILHIISSLCTKILDENKNAGAYAEEGIESFFSSYANSPWILILNKNIFKIKFSLIFLFIFLFLAAIYITKEIQEVADKSKPFILALGISPASLLSLSIIIFLFYLLISSFYKEFNKQKDELTRESHSGKKYSDDPVLNEIINRAQRLLQRIKYQKTLSTTTITSFKLPALVEGGANANVSLNEFQLSLPELIDKYKEMVAIASKKYMFFIGIDELDKIHSDEQAQNFLNSIKAIFGLENVFYFISVSENAMSCFERRGLPFRDTFDSSFDNVVYVEYLNLKESKNLLDLRVIGIPTPFLCLCYVISGGLPRDLIRICRKMLELLSKDQNKDYLNDICNTLIVEDLKSKIRATTFEAKKYGDSSKSIEFFEDIHKLDLALTQPLSLSICYNIEQDTNKSLYIDAPMMDELRSLKEELISYFYYCITLIDFFYDETANPDKYSIDHTYPFDELAKIRQYFEINPLIAKTLVMQFRETYADYLKKY
ncbi:MAG: P-loop NTPase fold protein [Methanothrix sp.]